jgi:hypothetical protein
MIRELLVINSIIVIILVITQAVRLQFHILARGGQP